VDIFDRLGNLIRTILDDDDPDYDSPRFADPDMSAAWAELEDYMKQDSGEAANAGPRTGMIVPDRLRRDFRNLEVPVGAPFEDVRASYKRLMTAFHPDRHAADPERLKTATEVTKKLNHSFHRIRTYYEKGA
jgi:DnaJ-domain-containing protein 1